MNPSFSWSSGGCRCQEHITDPTAGAVLVTIYIDRVHIYNYTYIGHGGRPAHAAEASEKTVPKLPWLTVA